MRGSTVVDYPGFKLTLNRIVNWGIRVLFRHAHAHQRTGDGAQASSDGSATKSSGERSCGNEGADPWDGQSANPDQPAAQAAKDSAGDGTGRSSRTGVGAGLFRNILGRLLVRGENADGVAGEPIVFECPDGFAGVFAIIEDADDSGTSGSC